MLQAALHTVHLLLHYCIDFNQKTWVLLKKTVSNSEITNLLRVIPQKTKKHTDPLQTSAHDRPTCLPVRVEPPLCCHRTAFPPSLPGPWKGL